MEKFKVLFRPLLAIIGLIIIVASFLFTRDVVVSLAMEEHGKMKLWAAATEQLIRADMQCDVTLEQGVITNNTTIPVILTDSLFNVLSYKNIDIKNPTQEELKVLAVKYSQQHEPIKVDVGDDVQLICYGNSILYKKLFMFPIVQFFVIGLFVVLIILAIKLMKSSEQNKVWVGLSKETAHQLGTPISSLMAWIEIMKSKYPDDDMFLEMDKDVIRLRTVAERFSQIGSTTELKKSCVNDVIERQVEYIRTRFSTKVEMSFKSDGEYMAMLNVPLFEWVIENLCKNSVDAMEGKGHIDITMSGTDTHVLIDVKDDGKGIGIKNKNMVFSPGYTTKKRGWGLGLSLVKRIVEEYHRGKIFVHQSVVGKGTTFRVVLRCAEGR